MVSIMFGSIRSSESTKVRYSPVDFVMPELRAAERPWFDWWMSLMRGSFLT